MIDYYVKKTALMLDTITDEVIGLEYTHSDGSVGCLQFDTKEELIFQTITIDLTLKLEGSKGCGKSYLLNKIKYFLEKEGYVTSRLREVCEANLGKFSRNFPLNRC